MPSLDPLLAHALRILQGAHRKRSPEQPECVHQLPGTVADRLLADDLSAAADLDVGVWGRAVYTSVARTAARLQTIAVKGDELS